MLTALKAVDALTGSGVSRRGSRFQASDECVGGVRRVCETKHESVCQTEHIKTETVEDHPVCRVEMVDNCEKSRSDLAKAFIICANFLIGPCHKDYCKFRGKVCVPLQFRKL